MRKKKKEKVYGGFLVTVIVVGGITYWLTNKHNEKLDELRDKPVCICEVGEMDEDCLKCFPVIGD